MFKVAKELIEKEKLKDNSKDLLVGLGIGGLAGAVSTAVVQPLDQIQNMMSTYKSNAAYKTRTKTYKDLVKAMYHGDMDLVLKDSSQYTKGLKGLKPFYAGLGVKLIKTMPQSALLLGLNTILYKMYKDKQASK